MGIEFQRNFYETDLHVVCRIDREKHGQNADRVELKLNTRFARTIIFIYIMIQYYNNIIILKSKQICSNSFYSSKNELFYLKRIFLT